MASTKSPAAPSKRARTEDPKIEETRFLADAAAALEDLHVESIFVKYHDAYSCQTRFESLAESLSNFASARDPRLHIGVGDLKTCILRRQLALYKFWAKDLRELGLGSVPPEQWQQRVDHLQDSDSRTRHAAIIEDLKDLLLVYQTLQRVYAIQPLDVDLAPVTIVYRTGKFLLETCTGSAVRSKSVNSFFTNGGGRKVAVELLEWLYPTYAWFGSDLHYYVVPTKAYALNKDLDSILQHLAARQKSRVDLVNQVAAHALSPPLDRAVTDRWLAAVVSGALREPNLSLQDALTLKDVKRSSIDPATTNFGQERYTGGRPKTEPTKDRGWAGRWYVRPSASRLAGPPPQPVSAILQQALLPTPAGGALAPPLLPTPRSSTEATINMIGLARWALVATHMQMQMQMGILGWPLPSSRRRDYDRPRGQRGARTTRKRGLGRARGSRVAPPTKDVEGANPSLATSKQ
jgi:hypothetical protein